MNKQNVLNDLTSRYETLTGSQKKIGKYVLDHYERVAFMSAVELAEVVGVSDATIIRFARNIGFSGYMEFKQHMRDGMKVFDSPDDRVSRSLELMQDRQDTVQQVVGADIDNLKNFLAELDEDAMARAVTAIHNARTIYVAGIGSSSVVVQFLQLHLRRMGFHVINVSESISISPEYLVNIGECDLLIACGFPRYSKGTLRTILFAKQKGATTLAITDSGLSALAVKSDIVLSARIENITFFHSYIVPMELCNVLMMRVLERNGKEIYQRMHRNIDSLKIFDMTI